MMAVYSIESEPWMGGPYIERIYRSRRAAYKAAVKLANEYGHDFEVQTRNDNGDKVGVPLLASASESPP